MTVAYWPTDIPQAVVASYSGGSRDLRTSFETVGPPITRPRTTGSVDVFSITSVPMKSAEFERFKTWVQSALSGGALRFCRRDPLSGVPRMWKIVSGDNLYQVALAGSQRVQITMTLIRLPGTLWFAPYVPEGSSRVPDFVADYAEGVYGIEGKKVAASALEDIAGDYFTVTTDAAAVTRKTETLTAGDIPATAPAGVTSIIGFAA